MLFEDVMAPVKKGANQNNTNFFNILRLMDAGPGFIVKSFPARKKGLVNSQ
jgi:hypothetical protein